MQVQPTVGTISQQKIFTVASACAGKHTASASSFLFDAVERSSLSAATEAAVQDIACEILEAEDCQ